MKTDRVNNNLVDYNSFFWTPEYVEPSAWIEHIPFAFWLIEALQPKSFVELGVHTGTSYFAFCQAIKTMNINTVCYGVDTWKGDEHAGYYNEEMFEKVDTYNAQYYAGFSTLIRSTFDEAREYFTDGYIDLLHIDGLHFYEAVKHDFEAWLPRLSKNAIVIFHDINVRERKFGVFKLWEELKQQYRSFQFEFGYGLGVLAIGEVAQDELNNLFNSNNTGSYYTFFKNLLFERASTIKDKLINSSLIAGEKNELEALNAKYSQVTENYNALVASNNKLKENYKTLELKNKELSEKCKYLSIKNEAVESKYKANLDKLQVTLKELNSQQQIIQWYKSTYEDRSILGTLKEKLRSAFKKKSSNPSRLDIRQPIVLPNNTLNNKTKKNRYHLIPGNELVFYSDTWEFLTEGADPFFIVHLKNKGLKAGWYWLSIEIIEIKNNISSPKLYYNCGRGFNEEDVWSLPEIKNSKIESLVYFPSDVTDLRFDPTTTRCTFSIREFHLRRLGKTKALLIAVSDYKKNRFPHSSYLSFFGKVMADSLQSKKFDFRQKLSDYIYNKDNSIDPDAYKKWCALYDTISENDVEIIKALANDLGYKPLISIIMPVYNAPIPFLKKAIESVKNQAYQNWELCIADDKSTDPAVKRLLSKYQAKDQRIKVIYRETNGHISNASNSALELATGEYIALLDQDDELRPHSLYMVARAINENKNLKLIYSDEDKIDENGNRHDPYFKPDWNIDYEYSFHYTNHLSVYRKTVLDEIGGFQKKYDGSQDYDLALRVTEKINEKDIHHIPHVLYHWRAIPGSMAMDAGSKNFAFTAGLNALNDHLKRTNQHAVAMRNVLTTHRVFRMIEGDLPKVAIIIPTKDKLDILTVCITSIITKTKYSNYEIIVVDNNSEERRTKEFFEENKDVFTVLRYEKEFNFSAINNYAVEQVDAEYICFLNNDTEVLNSDWLYEMVAHAQRKDVGAVGAKLYYPNDLIQHAGVTLHDQIPGRHVFGLQHKATTGYNFRLVATQSYLAVTGACLVVKKEKFLEAGKFDEVYLKVAYNDVDLCLKLYELGYKNIWTPFAELRHYESLSRGSDQEGENFKRYTKEKDHMIKKWPKYLLHDPYFNHNLSHHTVHISYNGEVANSLPWKKLNPAKNA
ncbi:glycosyltransferase [Niastella sp. OAS944]|uniref:glycosyltransferase n=1 Tax=Niastella sp. OAS944 TaxID=2664089 RepID=UPI003477576C|nr:glycosyltransferase involved in cell wall biosynthesis [Chitinophagaceae bacterium OAS944]